MASRGGRISGRGFLGFGNRSNKMGLADEAKMTAERMRKLNEMDASNALWGWMVGFAVMVAVMTFVILRS
jgi:hypothetical protein